MQKEEYLIKNACYSVIKYYLCKQNNKRSLLGRKQRSQVARSFPNRYQFSCINKVASLFSTSCILRIILRGVSPYFTRWNAANHFPFNFQPRHLHNCFTTQLGTSCVFDSLGLARNASTPGQHSQGDSTPSVLSFFCEGTLTIKPFMADNAEKAQHLRRCSPQTIH